jgi:hypothetical protein
MEGHGMAAGEPYFLCMSDGVLIRGELGFESFQRLLAVFSASLRHLSFHAELIVCVCGAVPEAGMKL